MTVIAGSRLPFGTALLTIALAAGCGGSSGRPDASIKTDATHDGAQGGDHSDSVPGDAISDTTPARDTGDVSDAASERPVTTDAGADLGPDLSIDVAPTDGGPEVGSGGSGTGGVGGTDPGGPGGRGGGAVGGGATGGAAGRAATGGATAGSGGGGTSGGATGGSSSGGTAGTASGGGGHGGTAGNASGGNGTGGMAGNGTGGSGSGGDHGSGGAGGTGAAAASLYLVTASTGVQTLGLAATDISLIDTVAGRAVRQATLLGTTGVAYRGGALLTAQASGYTRITVLNPDSLAVVRVQTLAWDPLRAVFSADGRYMYAAHDDGYVAQVRISDGVVTADLHVPPPPGGMDPSEIWGLAIDPTDTFLGLSSFHAGTGSSVGVVRISGQTLTVTYNWLSQPFPTSNCSRFAQELAFDRATTRLVAFDRNCSAFEVYSLATGLIDPTASWMFQRDGGTTAYSTTVVDDRGQVWATNFGNLYRAGVTDPTRQKNIAFGPEAGGLSIDSTGKIIYALQNDPRANGIFRVDRDTGTLTRQVWNLDLIPFGSVVVTSALIDRAPPAP